MHELAVRTDKPARALSNTMHVARNVHKTYQLCPKAEKKKKKKEGKDENKSHITMRVMISGSRPCIPNTRDVYATESYVQWVTRTKGLSLGYPDYWWGWRTFWSHLHSGYLAILNMANWLLSFKKKKKNSAWAWIKYWSTEETFNLRQPVVIMTQVNGLIPEAGVKQLGNRFLSLEISLVTAPPPPPLQKKPQSESQRWTLGKKKVVLKKIEQAICSIPPSCYDDVYRLKNISEIWW